MSERDDLVEALGLAPAISAINGCRSLMALEALRGEIDRRMAELGQKQSPAEQNSQKTGKRDGSLNPLRHIETILKWITEPFTHKDVAHVLHDIYKKNFGHEISYASAKEYAYRCIKHMLSEKLIEETGKKSPRGTGRSLILYKKKPKKMKPEGAEDGIYIADDEGKQRLRETLGIERELCDTGHFEDLPEVT